MHPQQLPKVADRNSSDVPPNPSRLQSAHWLSLALVLLALGIATSSILGPFGLGLMRYRTSHTTLNQLIGSDAATLLVVAPLTLAAAALTARRRPVGPLLALGVGMYALYTYAQIIIGQEYLRLPGNVERFFPLLLTVFLAAEAVVVLAWRLAPPTPRPSLRLERTAAVVLLLVAAFLVFGQHLGPILTAWRDPAALTEYASSPTPFWMVKLMDLGIIVPAAVATAVGLLKGAAWARRATYVLLTGYMCLAIAVAGMALTMYANADPDASLGLVVGFVAFALAFVTLTVFFYRPFLSRSAPDGSA